MVIDEGSSNSRARERPLPPFILKAYDIVSDPKTDSIISWNAKGTSFIVKDQHTFAAQVLKNYFRHDKFSSFIIQLNTYCFKKISWDKLEFQNEWFRRGKKHWLKNIKRRNQKLHNLHQCRDAYPESDSDISELMKEFHDLRHEHNALMAEIKKLNEWHTSAEEKMAVLKKRAERSANKQQKMARFMAVWMQKNEMQGANKCSLEGPEIESLMEELENEGNDMFLTVELCTQNQENDKNTICGVSSSELVLLEKQLMEDLEDFQDVPTEELTKFETHMVIDLEDLIEGPADWKEYTKELMGTPTNS